MTLLNKVPYDIISSMPKTMPKTYLWDARTKTLFVKNIFKTTCHIRQLIFLLYYTMLYILLYYYYYYYYIYMTFYTYTSLPPIHSTEECISLFLLLSRFNRNISSRISSRFIKTASWGSIYTASHKHIYTAPHKHIYTAPQKHINTRGTYSM